MTDFLKTRIPVSSDNFKFEYPKEEDIYMYYDGPLSYSMEVNGRRFYYHDFDIEWTEEHKVKAQYYLVRECSTIELEDLVENRISYLDFLNAANPLYLVKISGENVSAEQIDIKEIPATWLPTPGVHLFKD